MDIKTISDNYAAEHASEFLKSAIASAFADGYKQGYQDGLNACPVENSLSPKGPNFIDLGLPSGTLWADDFLRDNKGNIKFLTYDEASQYEIPTIDQWTEFIRCTRMSSEFNEKHNLDFVVHIGTNGNTLKLRTTGNENDMQDDSIYFVLKNVNDKFEAKTALIFKRTTTDIRRSSFDRFKGYRFPVLLVKSSEKV